MVTEKQKDINHQINILNLELVAAKRINDEVRIKLLRERIDSLKGQMNVTKKKPIVAKGAHLATTVKKRSPLAMEANKKVPIQKVNEMEIVKEVERKNAKTFKKRSPLASEVKKNEMDILKEAERKRIMVHNNKIAIEKEEKLERDRRRIELGNRSMQIKILPKNNAVLDNAMNMAKKNHVDRGSRAENEAAQKLVAQQAYKDKLQFMKDRNNKTLLQIEKEKDEKQARDVEYLRKEAESKYNRDYKLIDRLGQYYDDTYTEEDGGELGLHRLAEYNDAAIKRGKNAINARKRAEESDEVKMEAVRRHESGERKMEAIKQQEIDERKMEAKKRKESDKY